MSWRFYYFSDRTPNLKSKENRKFRELKSTGKVETVRLVHRLKIATSFWGHGWCRHLESFNDYENRLPRGRTYLRKGQVVHLKISPGVISAFVQGSDLYEQTIRIDSLPDVKWQALQSRCQGKISSLLELLNGRISSEIMTIVTDQEEGLFPLPKEIHLNCSCPDSATMCKHVAAVLYGVGARLDEKPELLFKLRGLDHANLISSANSAPVLGDVARTSGGRRRLDTAALGDVFGEEFSIDLETACEKVAAPKKASPKKASPKKASPKKASPKKASPKKAKVTARRKAVAPFKPTGKLVSNLRKQLQMAPGQFAAELGVSLQSIRNWESTRGPLNLTKSSREKLESLFRKHS